MIRYKIVESAYDRNIIKLAMSPNNDGVVCKIGEYWFYFGGYVAKRCRTIEEYKAIVSEDEIIKDIFIALNDFFLNKETEDEYHYYRSYLYEKLNSAFAYEKIRAMCYELYKIDWKRSHLISYECEMDVIKNYYQDYLPNAGRKPMTYQEYLEEVGYGGMMYACFDEFMDLEYQNKEYIYNLLENEEYIALYEKDLANMEEK